MRHPLRALAVATAVFLHPPSVSAQNYPARPVQLIVPLAAGGGTDIVARHVATQLSEIWRQQVVVDNRGGAGGMTGAMAAAHAAADGYTLLVAVPSLITNTFIYPSVAYDPISDFKPISLICVFPNLMVVPISSPAKSVSEFIGYARANPGKLSYASSGVGTTLHLSGELFKREAGVDMTHVPYRGAGPAFNDLIPGRVDVMFGNITSTLAQTRAGALRALAVTSGTRSPLAPDIPTIAESGVPGFDVSAWYGLLAPAKTPNEIIRKIHGDVATTLGSPALKARLAEIGAQVSPTTPEEFGSYLESEMKKWGPIIRAANIKPQ